MTAMGFNTLNYPNWLLRKRNVVVVNDENFPSQADSEPTDKGFGGRRSAKRLHG